MLGTIAAYCRRYAGIALVASLAQALPTRADELTDFHAAVERALDQYHFAMSVLETGSQEQTSTEVGRLRQSWRGIAERFAKPPDGFAGADDYGSNFLQIDMQLISLLLIIELGNREAARASLSAVGDFLEQWSAKSVEPR